MADEKIYPIDMNPKDILLQNEGGGGMIMNDQFIGIVGNMLPDQKELLDGQDNVNGTNMTFGGYTYIKPHPKYGTMGFNASYINIKLKGESDYTYSFMSSLTGFWTKPYQINLKTTLSPGVFIMSSPYSYNTGTGNTWNYNISGLVGCGYSFKISKRFGFQADYKVMVSTVPGSPILSFFLIGSKMQL